MKITEAKYKSCPTCDHRTQEAGEEYGCDVCKTPINRHSKGKHNQYLQAAIFRSQGGETSHMEFCSWKCCLSGLKKVRTDYFVTLPYLLYDETQKGIRAKDFFDAIKAFK